MTFSLVLPSYSRRHDIPIMPAARENMGKEEDIMTVEFVTTRADAARAATGSDLVIAGGWGFVANVLPIDLGNDRTHLPEQVEAQTRKVLSNFEAIIKDKGFAKD